MKLKFESISKKEIIFLVGLKMRRLILVDYIPRRVGVPQKFKCKRKVKRLQRLACLKRHLDWILKDSDNFWQTIF